MSAQKSTAPKKTIIALKKGMEGMMIDRVKNDSNMMAIISDKMLKLSTYYENEKKTLTAFHKYTFITKFTLTFDCQRKISSFESPFE